MPLYSGTGGGGRVVILPEGRCVAVAITDKDPLSEGCRDDIGVSGRDRVFILFFAEHRS